MAGGDSCAAAASLVTARTAFTAQGPGQDSTARRDSVPASKSSKPRRTQPLDRGGIPAKPKPVWPVKADAPRPGSILPDKRIVAYYGNPLSKRMGILGELPPDEMLKKLEREVRAWEKADSTTPVVPALHLIAVVAQGSAGRDGMYRARMADTLVERVYGWAQRHKAIMFLDIQVAKSTLQQELPRLAPFLSRPDVHLGLDPEFSMKRGGAPGKRIGTYDAADVNYAIDMLADLVEKHNLPPKVLVIHRFTRPDADEREQDQARSARPGRDSHGRLGSAVDEEGFLRGVRVRGTGAVHGLQAVLQERHEEGTPADEAGRRAGAVPEAALHPVPVRVERSEGTRIRLLIHDPASVRLSARSKTSSSVFRCSTPKNAPNASSKCRRGRVFRSGQDSSPGCRHGTIARLSSVGPTTSPTTISDAARSSRRPPVRPRSVRTWPRSTRRLTTLSR